MSLIKKNRADELIVSSYFNELLQEQVLSDPDKDRIEELPSRRQQAERFLDILIRKPASSIQAFFDMVKTQSSRTSTIGSFLASNMRARN